MRYMNSLLLACLLLCIQLSPASAAESVSLDGDASKQVQRFLDEVSGGLHGATLGQGEARNTLMARAMMPRFFSDELDVFATKANEDGGAASVKLTGFEVNATLWLGVIPVEKVSLFFWVGENEFRVLKLDRDESHTLAFFGEPQASTWSGETAEAFGTLADKILKAASQGQCGSVPLVRPSDVMAGKKVPKAAKVIEDQAARSTRDCSALSGMPYNRLTWKLGPTSGVVTTRKKAKLGFGFELLAGPERDVRVYRLTRPQGAR
jgi:hypothetical protein